MAYVIALAKTAALYLLMWGVTRRIGKHLIRRITLFDFVSSVTLGSLAASAVVDGQPTAVIAACIALWGLLTILSDTLTMQGRSLQAFLDGDPVVLVENGKVIEENLRRERVTLKQLESQLRLKGYFDLSTIEMALMEPNGEVSVRPRSQNRPVQPADLKLPTQYEALTTQIVQEGRPLTKELRGLGLSERWLADRLKAQGVADVREVFVAWLTSDGRLVVDRYNDSPGAPH